MEHCQDLSSFHSWIFVTTTLSEYISITCTWHVITPYLAFTVLMLCTMACSISMLGGARGDRQDPRLTILVKVRS